MCCTQHVKVLGEKRIPNHDLWHPFDKKGSDVIMCDSLTVVSGILGGQLAVWADDCDRARRRATEGQGLARVLEERGGLNHQLEGDTSVSIFNQTHTNHMEHDSSQGRT